MTFSEAHQRHVMQEEKNAAERVLPMRKKLLAAMLPMLLVVVMPQFANMSDSIEAVLFPGQVSVNNKEVSVSSETPILNYNGNTYVPLRALVEQLGGGVFYEQADGSVRAHLHPTRQIRSEVSSLTTDGDFTLALHSGKKVFTEQEPISVWSALTYTGELETTIAYGEPIITFTLEDSEGNMYGEKQYLVENRTVLSKGNEYIVSFPWDIIKSMNYAKSGLDNWTQFEEQSETWLLPKGTYTIGALCDFTLPPDPVNKKLRSQITIEVKESAENMAR